MGKLDQASLDKAAKMIKRARRVTAFTGAGISVESGVPPFRGPDGLWSRYDPACFEINFFRTHPETAWPLIKKMFFDTFREAHPNDAHLGLARMETAGRLRTVITQNIDNLHQAAGSKEVYEFHGNARYLVCLECEARYGIAEMDLDHLPPVCPVCHGMLKPDFIFFGEMIPERVHSRSLYETIHSDIFLVIGTSGEVMPASMIPAIAKQNGAGIIEINISPSNYTGRISDIFLAGQASDVINDLVRLLEI
nr:NAD-dependent deacylase [candidate division Zixibacteria bacterium]